MSELPSARHCYDCGADFDYDAYWDHFVECGAFGCGESYCPSNFACTFCNGQGFNYDSEDDYDSDPCEGTGIYSYDYKPEPVWFGGSDQPYYLGFELEISAGNFDTSPIYRWCEDHGHRGMLYCKEDGSVDGFEIVSHPMTPEFFDSVPWDSFFEMLESNWPMRGYDEPTGHGLHVHVSRTAFPHNSTLARWSYLLNRYQSHVERVARRTSSNWARFTPYPVSLTIPYENPQRRGRWESRPDPRLVCGCCTERVWVADTMSRIRHQFQTRAYPERYQAVNLTNSHTVEVRVFRSTRKTEEFTAALHFVAATVEFVRTMQPWHATRVALAWETFADYVASHPVFSKQAQILAGITPPPPEPEPVSAPSTREIREWARAQGYPVGRRGRIPAHIRLIHSLLTSDSYSLTNS